MKNIDAKIIKYEFTLAKEHGVRQLMMQELLNGKTRIL